MSTWVDAMDQPLWDYDADGDLVEPNDVPGGSSVTGPIGMPEGALVASETTGGTSATALRARAAAAALALFGFNPGQRRGPDGKWVKMGGAGSAGGRKRGHTSAPEPAVETDVPTSPRHSGRNTTALAFPHQIDDLLAEVGDGDDERSEYIRRAIQSRRDLGDESTLVVSRDAETGDLTGAATYTFRDDAGADTIVIEYMGAAPDSRAGTDLVREVMKTAVGLDGILIEPTPSSIGFWERLGFKPDPLDQGTDFMGLDQEDMRRWLVDHSGGLYAAAADGEFGFNPHQRRGPDGRWIKMGTHERKSRRRERDRQRRADREAQQQKAGPWRDTEMPISELLDIAMANRLDPDNPKIQALADDIRKNGLTRRLQVEDSPKGMFLGDGHHRLIAAQLAGLDRVPVRIFDATPEGRQAANRAMANGGDNSELQVERPFAPGSERRAAEVDPEYRRQRDAHNLQIREAAQDQRNDMEFDGEEDPQLVRALKGFNDARRDGDNEAADRNADILRQRLMNEHGHAELPQPPVPRDAGAVAEEAEIQQKLREQLDDYNAEMHAVGKAWLDTLDDPQMAADLGMSPEALDNAREYLRGRVEALRKHILQGVPAAADQAADNIRSVLVLNGFQAEHDLPQMPSEVEIRNERRALQFARPTPRSSGSLAANRPVAERLAELDAALASGVWGEEPLGQGAMGETKRLLLNDGTTVISKRARGTWPYGGVDWTPKQQTDAEELSAIVGNALGLRSPAVQRVDETTINMEFVPDAAPGWTRFYSGDKPGNIDIPPDVLGSDDALKMGLFDVLIGNPDRHGFNWMVDDANNIYPIDNGLAFVNLKGTNASDAGRSPFAAEYFVHPSGQFKENILSRRDIQWVREQVEALAPEFQRAGQPGWYTQIQNRLRQVEIRARGGSQHQLPAPRGEERPV